MGEREFPWGPIIERALRLAAQDQKGPLEATAKLTEELGELMREVLILSGAPGTTYRPTTHEKQIEELADVLLCAIALVDKLNIDRDDLSGALHRKMDKWKRNIGATEESEPGREPRF